MLVVLLFVAFFDYPFVFVYEETCVMCCLREESAVGVCSASALQECVEQSCVDACRSYFWLSRDAAAPF